MRLLVPFLALFSGAAALTWQVLWVRQLSLVVGIGSWAMATVLAVFMGGLALGSWLLGRHGARVSRPLLLFGLLELGIAACALLLPFGWRALEALTPWLWQLCDGQPLALGLARALAVALLLGLPTTLMGGTLPVLARPASRGEASLARDVGRLYGANTLGAVAGCLASGFVLLPSLGLAGTSRVAAVANAAVGLVALLGAWRLGVRPPSGAGATGVGAVAAATEPTRAARNPLPSTRVEAPTGSAGARTRRDDGAARVVPPPADERRLPVAVVLLIVAVAGMAGLGYEVLWSRVLAFFLHNSTYAFSIMLACFLAGLGLGSLLPCGAVDRARRPALLLAGCQLAVGLLTLMAVGLYPLLPRAALALAGALTLDAWWKAVTLQGLLAAGMLLPSTFFMGLTFPVTVRLLARSTSVSRDVGWLSAANTAGAIAGSLAVGFALVPALGLVGTFRLLVAANLGAALLALLTAPRLPARVRAGAVATVLLLGGGGLASLPADLFREAFRRGEVLLHYADGAAETAMVRTPALDAEERWLVLSDGRGTAGTTTNAMNRFYGHLPLLLHGRAKEVLSICFGSGNTLAAIALHPEVEHVDAVELSPEVLAAAPFFPTNERVWEDPKVDVHVADGRHWLLAHERRYDVIQLEPPEIHTAGVVNLYTREFYELARRRLQPGGLLCQWANVRLMSLQAQRMLVATFLEVFPQGTLWLPKGDIDYILLVGGEAPLDLDYDALKARCQEGPVGKDLREVVEVDGVVPLLACFKLGPFGARRFAADAPVLTDDRTRVDFLAPRTRDANFGLVNAFSGLRLDMTDAWEDQRRYMAEKLGEMRRHVESVFPFLHDFPGEVERASVRERLWQARESADAALADRIARIEQGLEAPVSY